MIILELLRYDLCLLQLKVIPFFLHYFFAVFLFAIFHIHHILCLRVLRTDAHTTLRFILIIIPRKFSETTNSTYFFMSAVYSSLVTVRTSFYNFSELCENIYITGYFTFSTPE